ncbi:MAG: spermidine/putrescine transporter substrate-binding protein [Burkholderiales bacterium]|jgi:spermidine/putrescine-binding protein|nr:spermidine/putrescine transporter substrate-binding protein [Burkholderiales bacterium]
MKQFIFLLSLLVNLTYAEKILNVYIGANYIADNTITRLQQICNCRLAQNYFNDNEEMLAKIVAGANGYNVIVATSYAVDELAKMNKIAPLDFSKIPNIKSIDPKFMNQSYDRGNKYSVPYAYTPVFLAYNKNKMESLGIKPDTWAVVFDPKYLVKLKGHITMFSSSRHVFAAALMYMGKDPNTTNKADLTAARNLIDKSSPYWAKFDSDSYYRGLLRGDIWLSMSYSIDIFKTIQDAKASSSPIKIDAMLQKEGNMYELDNLVIPKSSPDIKMSYDFINNALNPQSAYELSNATGSSIPNAQAFKKLNDNITKIDWIYPNDMRKMHVLNAYDPKTRVFVNEMWTEIQMQCHY